MHESVDGFIVPGGPFATANVYHQILHYVSCSLIRPWYIILDYLLSMFISTTDESYQHRSKSEFYFCIKVILCLTLILCFLPLALVGFIIWFPLQILRPRPYSFSCPTTNLRCETPGYERISATTDATSNLISCAPLSNKPCLGARSYSVVSANLCLAPEFVAHINNLANTVTRGRKIAAYLCGEAVDSLQCASSRSIAPTSKAAGNDGLFQVWSSDSINLAADSESASSAKWSVTSKERAISDVFPGPVDFLCLQEVFDSRSTKHLLAGLKSKYPYIIYDVSWPIHNYRLTLVGSGLCIASRHPFIDITFRPFPDGSRDDKLACKGLLMTKVYLGKSENGSNQVGYLATTHLQAWERRSASAARCRQLNSIESWMEEFFETSRRMDGKPEVVLFNVITGDLNFDKNSHFDRNEQSCSFVQNFNDPCMDETGALHSWAVGTSLHQKRMHDKHVRTPQGLQRMLVSELERCQYVQSTVPIKTSSLQRIGDGKRKIDYILYKDCEEFSLVVKDYKFFTGLTTLSDHLPIGMVFNCEQNDTSAIEA